MITVKPIHKFYYHAYTDLVDNGYESEIDYTDSIPPLEKQSPIQFFNEYVWCVLNAGMREQIARKMYDNYITDYNIHKISHPSKRKAIIHVSDNYNTYFQQLYTSPDPVAYLETLPWIGGITKYHLARNLGIDVVKPDRHLVRLANAFGYPIAHDMCLDIQRDNNTRLGTIDFILWRYCNLHGMPEILVFINDLIDS